MYDINNHPVRRLTNHLTRRRFQLVTFLLVVAVVCWTGAALGTRSDSARSAAAVDLDSDADKSAAKLVEALAGPTVQRTVRRTIETVTVRLGTDGFSPTEVRQPRGIFFLMVENETGLDEVELRFDREIGSPIHQVAVPRKNRDWAEPFDLLPGRYVLTETNHPGWSCSIMVTTE